MVVIDLCRGHAYRRIRGPRKEKGAIALNFYCVQLPRLWCGRVRPNSLATISAAPEASLLSSRAKEQEAWGTRPRVPGPVAPRACSICTVSHCISSYTSPCDIYLQSGTVSRQISKAQKTHHTNSMGRSDLRREASFTAPFCTGKHQISPKPHTRQFVNGAKL